MATAVQMAAITQQESALSRLKREVANQSQRSPIDALATTSGNSLLATQEAVAL